MAKWKVIDCSRSTIPAKLGPTVWVLVALLVTQLGVSIAELVLRLTAQ